MIYLMKNLRLHNVSIQLDLYQNQLKIIKPFLKNIKNQLDCWDITKLYSKSEDCILESRRHIEKAVSYNKAENI